MWDLRIEVRKVLGVQGQRNEGVEGVRRQTLLVFARGMQKRMGPGIESHVSHVGRWGLVLNEAHFKPKLNTVPERGISANRETDSILLRHG